MSYIDAIKDRHSVRNYRPDRIEESKVQKIKQMIDEVNNEGNLHLQFIENAGIPIINCLTGRWGLEVHRV